MARNLLQVLVALTFLAAALSGCQEAPAAKTVEDVFGDKNVIPVNGIPTIRPRVTEAAFVSPADKDTPVKAWSFWPNLTVVQPRLDYTNKPDPGPSGGGGENHPLLLDMKGTQLVVRFNATFDLTGFQTSWALLDDNNRATTWTDPLAGAQSPPINISNPGRFKVVGRVIDPAGVATAVMEAVVATVNAEWEVHSKVHPFAPRSPSNWFGPQLPPVPRPPNYAEMADEFPVTMGGYGGRLELDTEFDGTWQPTDGYNTNVDLEVLDPSGKTANIEYEWAQEPGWCSRDYDSGFGLVGLPDANEARETGTINELYTGKWTVRVGAVGCKNDYGNYYYENTAPVPYKLTVTIDFGDTPKSRSPRERE